MSLRQRVAASRLARLAALPGRVSTATRHVGSEAGLAMHWLVSSREHHNFTYDLTPRNLEHLAWWVSAVSSMPVNDCRGWISEVLHDQALQRHVQRSTLGANRRQLADNGARLGRRAGWYALIRALQPEHIVETGTDKGLGSIVIASALMRNGNGHLTTIDVNPASGYLISGRYAGVTTVELSDSISALERLPSDVGLFIHDSDHDPQHESHELKIIESKLVPEALVLSDNAHASDSLALWAGSTGRNFLYFQEVPHRHWYSGAGIGAAWGN